MVSSHNFDTDLSPLRPGGEGAGGDPAEPAVEGEQLALLQKDELTLNRIVRETAAAGIHGPSLADFLPYDDGGGVGAWEEEGGGGHREAGTRGPPSAAEAASGGLPAPLSPSTKLAASFELRPRVNGEGMASIHARRREGGGGEGAVAVFAVRGLAARSLVADYGGYAYALPANGGDPRYFQDAAHRGLAVPCSVLLGEGAERAHVLDPGEPYLGRGNYLDSKASSSALYIC